jgi:hypothetical protein
MLTIHFLLFSGYSSDVLLVLFFWQVPRHLRCGFLYGLVAIDPAFLYRISTGIARAFYRTKADLLVTFRNDPAATRAMSVICQDPAAF